MSGHWPAVARPPDAAPAHLEYAGRWTAMPKVVFCRTASTTFDGNARLQTGDAVAEVARLKAEDGGPMDIAGATLPSAAMRAGLIDEYVLSTAPVLIGDSTPLSAALEDWVELRLVETRSSRGIVLTRYEKP